MHLRPPIATLRGLCAAAFAAPDEAANGATHGYSHGHTGNWFSRTHAVGAFTAMDQLFPVRPVPAGSDVRALPHQRSAPDRPFVRHYLDTHPATGLIALKDGRILLEHYQYERHAEHRFTSFSMPVARAGARRGDAVTAARALLRG